METHNTQAKTYGTQRHTHTHTPGGAARLGMTPKNLCVQRTPTNVSKLSPITTNVIARLEGERRLVQQDATGLDSKTGVQLHNHRQSQRTTVV